MGVYLQIPLKTKRIPGTNTINTKKKHRAETDVTDFKSTGLFSQQKQQKTDLRFSTSAFVLRSCSTDCSRASSFSRTEDKTFRLSLRSCATSR